MNFRGVIISAIILGITLIVGWFFFAREQKIIIEPDPSGIIQNDFNSTTQNISSEVSSVRADERNGNIFIKARYPVTNSSSANSYLRDFVLNSIYNFKQDTAWLNDLEESPLSLSLSIDYKVYQSDEYNSYVFSTDSYTGGAHGVQANKTLVFDKNGRNLNIRDFVQPEKLKDLSDQIQSELLKQPNADKTWVQDGAGEKYSNFEVFYLDKENIVFVFDPYQVAPYSEGVKRVILPISTIH